MEALSATASRHPAFMANELGQPARRARLVSRHLKAGTSSPKGGDIPWTLLETRHRPHLGAAVGEGTPWRKLSAN